MKIFVTGTRGIPGIMGGVETHCEHLYPRLAAMGYDITVVRRSSYAGGDGLTQWRGVKLLDIAAPRRKSLEAIVHTLRAVVAARRARADVVHIHAVGPSLAVPLAKMLGMRVVTTNHGPDYEREKWGRMAAAAIRLGERWASRMSDDVIVISDTIRRNVAQRYGRTNRVHLIHNGVPAPEPCSQPGYFASLGIAPGRYVLAMSRFVPEKNLHHLVEAFDRAGLAKRGYRLVLAGDADFPDDYSRSLKQTASERGAVLTGFVSGRRLHALLANAALFVLPSSHEGLPIALLEAMSYQLPVVVSDIAANAEVGLPAADYFPVGDVDALASRLASKLPPPAADAAAKPASNGENAPARVDYDLSPYDWDTIARQVADVYSAPPPR